MDTSRLNEVKTPQHDGTPRSHAHARVQEVAHVVEVVEADEIRTEGAALAKANKWDEAMSKYGEVVDACVASMGTA